MKNRFIFSLLCSLTLLLLSSVFTPCEAAITTTNASSGALRYTIAVAQFENRSNWSGQYQLGDAYGAVLTDALNQSGKYIVLGEKDIRSDAAGESGQQGTAAQLLIKGVITHVQNTSNSGGGFSIGGVLLGGSQSESEINVTMYIVETASGRVLASKSVVGKSSGGGILIGGGGAVFGTHHKDNMGKAVENAIAQTLDWLNGQMPSIKWSGLVILNEDGNIYINRGSREGVKVGQKLIAGSAKILRDPVTKEVLDESLTELATLEVVTVKEKIAICSVISGSADELQPGTRVQQP